MPLEHRLPNDVRERLARQIGERPTPNALRTRAASDRMEVAESFPIWHLSATAARQAGTTLDTASVFTGYWHTQIHHGGQAVEYAHSKQVSRTQVDLHATFSSPL